MFHFTHPLAWHFMLAFFSLWQSAEWVKKADTKNCSRIALCTSVYRITLPLWGLDYCWVRRPAWSKIPWEQSTSWLPIISSNNRKSAMCTCGQCFSLHSLAQVWVAAASVSWAAFTHPGGMAGPQESGGRMSFFSSSWNRGETSHHLFLHSLHRGLSTLGLPPATKRFVTPPDWLVMVLRLVRTRW